MKAIALLVCGLLTGTLLAVPAAVWATHRFADVGDDHPHAPGIEYVEAAGITSGCDSERFCPGASVTRGQMATFLHRSSGNSATPPSVNARSLEGRRAADLQQRVTGSCATGAISSIREDGSVSCGAGGGFTEVSDDVLAYPDQGRASVVLMCPSGTRIISAGADPLVLFPRPDITMQSNGRPPSYVDDYERRWHISFSYDPTKGDFPPTEATGWCA